MILIRLKGGLGNQMFQYATALAVAIRLGKPLRMDLTLLKDRNNPDVNMVFREYELGPFRLSEDFATQDEVNNYNPSDRTIIQRIRNRLKHLVSPPRLYIEQLPVFDPEVLNLPDDYCLVGSFQTEKYFKHLRREVLQAFSFRSPFDPKTEALASQIRGTNSLCVHVRRGDYIQNPVFNKILGALPLSYYQEGMNRFTGQEIPQEVYVFSDDIPWCRENLKFEMKTTFVSEELAPDNHHVHLYLMSQCRYFLISNSTFSWWGAWLSERKGKRVIGPGQWFADKTRNSTDILPETWERI